MVPLEELYQYAPLKRVTADNGKRFYVAPDGNKLSSVTTILGATADKTFLEAWQKRIGHAKANAIRNEAAGLGTLMHEHLESWLLGRERPKGTAPIRILAQQMSDTIIARGLPRINKLWGIEAPLYYPGLYAGTSDMIGEWDGEPAIMDFKNTRKMKKRDWIEDYFIQTVAYGMAHDIVYGTEIRQGVILMVDRECKYQEFIIKGDEYQGYCRKWADRLERFFFPPAK